MKRFILLFTVAIISVNICSALPREGFAYLSKCTTNPDLSNAFVESEMQFKVGDYKKATEILEGVLKSKDPNIQKELKNNVAMVGPLGYYTDAFRLFYLNKINSFMNPSIAAELNALEAKYLAEKQDERWAAYELVLENLEENYGRQREGEKQLVILENFLNYKPNDAYRLDRYLRVLLIMDKDPKEMRAAFATYKGAGGGMNSNLALYECKVVESEGGDTLGATFAWFKKNHDASNGDLIKMMDYCRTLLDVEKPESIKRYYLKLTSLALAQSHDPKRMPVLSTILNERKKLEAIVPELIPSISTNTLVQVGASSNK